MIEWTFVKGSIYDDYDCYKLKYKEHTICVKVIGKTNGYVLQWHRGTVLELQKPFGAPSLDEAKEYAINVVKNYVAERAMYWRDINDGLNDLIEN